MNRLVVCVILVAGVLVACGQEEEAGTTSLPPDTTLTAERNCTLPPEEELAADLDVQLAVDPNPVAAGSPATLSIEQGALPPDSSVGAGAVWQCWDGSGWVDTHQIVKAFNDGQDAQAIAVKPGATTTIPAIALPIPSSYPIVIPEVEPGTYRIVDEVFAGGEGAIRGFVLVEVIEG
ncbi:MAG: hypothetical protein ACRDVL_07220 [Acidimicrobiia bacterium]